MNIFKKLIRSKTINGILVAAAGAVIDHSRALLTPEVMAQYGVYIQLAAAALQTTGLGTAVYGRIKAQGPLEAPMVSDFDGTGGELPR